MAKLGNVEIFNEQESEDVSVNITEYNVEEGASFADHVRSKHPTFSVSGYIFGDTVAVLSELKESQSKGERLAYVGRTTAEDVLIEKIGVKYNSAIANGCAVTITLRKIRVTKTPHIKAPPVEVPARKPVSNEGAKKPAGVKPNPEKYHTVVRGDTYWGCAKKYGVSVQSLQKWNPWPDRFIPIGVRMRVG